MSKVRIRTATACRIVRLDRLKFNEAVSDGAYPCAPPTIAGRTRAFDLDEMVTLYFFARLIDFGLTTRHAGHLACKVVDELRADNLAHNDRVTFVRGTSGQCFFAPTTKKYPEGTIIPWYSPDHEKEGTHYPGLGRIIFSIDFYVSHVRQIIADAIEEERNILGEED